MGILDGIVEWIAQQVMNGLDLISTSVLGALGCDMGTFLRYFPAAETLYKVFVAAAIGLVLLNWVWQLFKNFGLVAGVEAEDPIKLSIRSVLFIGLIYYCNQITDIILAIGGTPYSWILTSEVPPLNFADFNSVLLTILGACASGSVVLIALILLLILAWNYIKLLFEAAERYILLGVIVYTAPMAFATGASQATSNIFKSWCRMFGGQIFLLMMNAYFCITSDQDSTFDFLSSLFMSFVFIKLVRYADKYGDGGKLPVPVHILADELANGGCTIVDLTKKISTIRSRQLSISCIFQNLPQMQNRYPLNQWQEIIGNCDTQLFLGCTDELTAEFISNRTGEVSVAVSSQAKQLNTWRVSDYTPEYRETHSIGKRKLLTPDEVLRLPLDEALIILRGQKVLKVGKYDYTLHPESKKLKESRASDHIPEWRRLPESPEPDFSRLMKPEPKPKKTKAPRNNPAPTDAAPSGPPPEWADEQPAFFPGDCEIVMTDKKSIMS